MALKALLLRKKITDKQKEQAALETKSDDYRKREKELEDSIAEAASDEEKTAVEEAVTAFEQEKADTETAKSKLIAEIGELEEELRRLEEENTVPAAPAEEERKKDMENTETREKQIQAERKAFAEHVRSLAGIARRDDPPADYNMTQGNNGAIIPKSIASEIITKVKDICPIFERATHYNVKGTLEVPYYPASADHVVGAAFVTEMDELVASSGDFGAVELTGFVAGALAKISKKLINNTDVDVIPFIVDQMAEAFKIFFENQCINGTVGKVAGVLAGVTQFKTAANKSTLTADDLIGLQMAIPTAYQSNACWIMKPATLEQVRKLKDGSGRYLLNPDIRNEFGWTLLGKPVFLSEVMPAMGTANNKAVLYGDLTGLGVKVTEALEVQVLNERFVTQHAVGVVGWTEFDAKVVNAQKLAAIKMGAADPT